MMPALHDLALGWSDPVDDAQRCFRAALRALSRPGEAVEVPAPPAVPGLQAGTVALLLTLTDADTPVFWCGPEASRWLRFHTGAPLARRAAEATFVVAADGHALPALDHCCSGSDASPERSSTLLIELPGLTGGRTTVWSGPGLQHPRALALPAPLVADDADPAGAAVADGDAFWRQWQAQQLRFPTGVDVFFVAGRQLVGLPRTTRVHRPRER